MMVGWNINSALDPKTDASHAVDVARTLRFNSGNGGGGGGGSGRGSGDSGTIGDVGGWKPFENPCFEAWKAWKDEPLERDKVWGDGSDYLNDSNFDDMITNSPPRTRKSYEEVINQFHVDKVDRYKDPNGVKTYCNIFVWDVTSAMTGDQITMTADGKHIIAMGAIPNWRNSDGNPVPARHYSEYGAKEHNANGMVDWLNEHGHKHGWKKIEWKSTYSPEVDQAKGIEKLAQNKANLGYPVAAVWKNTLSKKELEKLGYTDSEDETEGAGHTAIVRPETSKTKRVDIRGVCVAQAGVVNHGEIHLADAFKGRKDKIGSKLKGKWKERWENARNQIEYWFHD